MYINKIIFTNLRAVYDRSLTTVLYTHYIAKKYHSTLSLYLACHLPFDLGKSLHVESQFIHP